MQIPFNEANRELVDQVNSVDLERIFGMIRYNKKGDPEKEAAIAGAIQLLKAYCFSYPNHQGKFLPTPMPIVRKSSGQTQE